MRQLFFQTSVHVLQDTYCLILYRFLDSRLALRFEEVRILQSKNASSTLSKREF